MRTSNTSSVGGGRRVGCRSGEEEKIKHVNKYMSPVKTTTQLNQYPIYCINVLLDNKMSFQDLLNCNFSL